MRSTSEVSVKRRKVFYIPGYDPFPPRRYRELYRSEGASQAALSGYHLSMTHGLAGDGFGWCVEMEIDGAVTETEIEVLVWSDIVQDSFGSAVWMTYWAMVGTAWVYFSTGAIWRLMRLRKGPVIAAFYPVLVLLLQLVGSVGLTWWVSQVALALANDGLVAFGWVARSTVEILVYGFAILGAVWILRMFQKHDGKVFAHYLMHDFAYSASKLGAYPDQLSERLKIFSDQISAALGTEVDEVLVVGHSSGAHLAVTALAQVLRQTDATQKPALSFLSLGHVVPMVSFLPAADELRRDLRFLSNRSDLTWVDVTAPGDGCSFALCDPVGVSGQTTPQKQSPLVMSAAFTQSLSPERWRSLRWRFFRLHFQYLCAFDQPKDYDYFQITGGALTLAERYKDRPQSPSRITRSVTKYTATAP